MNTTAKDLPHEEIVLGSCRICTLYGYCPRLKRPKAS